MITPTEHEKREWSRMAVAAYLADRNDIGHRYSGAASIRKGEQLSVACFDFLQDGYRAWLIDSLFPCPMIGTQGNPVNAR